MGGLQQAPELPADCNLEDDDGVLRTEVVGAPNESMLVAFEPLLSPESMALAMKIIENRWFLDSFWMGFDGF